MKNFPNQASDLVRIRRTLQLIDQLNAQGVDTSDDGVLGYALARERAYTFRNFDYDGADVDQRLEERITLELAKPGSNQGARTNAREMRRTFVALGWLEPAGVLTDAGRELLQTNPGSQEERLLLVEALLDLEVADRQGNVSHPVRIMLDLLAQAPSLHRDGLELALEAADDSDAERLRVRRLYAMGTQQRAQALAALGATDTTIQNAKKIFPTLARTAGLIVEDEHGYYLISPDGQAVIGQPGVAPRTALRRAAHGFRRSTAREVDADSVARDRGATPRRPLTEAEQQRAAELLRERTDRHQRTVRALARLISRPGRLFEDPLSYDLLWVPGDESEPIVLFEIKTLDDDVAEQCRRAVAQLGWYHFFDVSPEWPERAVLEVAVFDESYVEPKYLDYLTSEEILVLQVDEDGGLRALTPQSEGLLSLLGYEEEPED